MSEVVDMSDLAEEILDLLEKYNCTLADGVAVMEMVKFNLLRVSEGTQEITLQ